MSLENPCTLNAFKVREDVAGSCYWLEIHIKARFTGMTACKLVSSPIKEKPGTSQSLFSLSFCSSLP